MKTSKTNYNKPKHTTIQHAKYQSYVLNYIVLILQY